MLFDRAIQNAKFQQRKLADQIESVNASQAKIAEALHAHVRYYEKELLPFTSGLGRSFVLRDWRQRITRLEAIQRRLRKKLAKLEAQKFKVEFWILEKEETWGKIEQGVLKEQLREILIAAQELGRFLLGRNVTVAFDIRDNAPLGWVPVRANKKRGYKVYLSADILGKQPKHLLDYYRALLVHELGHLLLHIKGSGKDYRRFGKLLQKKISVARGFWEIFNTLLDEQLERILRDTKKEWQRWFNRLDFYVARMPLVEFRESLAQNGVADPEATMNNLAERKIIKIYDDRESPFAVIQSAQLFSECPGFSRLYAFFAVLRNRLPLATVQETWLKECLACIPKNFKTLDVFEVHALAVEIYKIMMEGQGLRFLKLKVNRGESHGMQDIEVPGTRVHKSENDLVLDVTSRKKKKGGRGGSGGGSIITKQTHTQNITPPPNPEGEPPPPEQRQTTTLHKKPTPAAPKSHGIKPWLPSGGGSSGPIDEPPIWLWEERGRGGRTSRPGRWRGFGKAKPILSPQEQLKAKQRSGKLSAKEKARLQKQIKEETKNEAQQKQQEQQKQLQPPPPPKPKSIAPPPEHKDEIKYAEKLASANPPSWSAKSAAQEINKTLDNILKEIQTEMAAKAAGAVKVEGITPEQGQPADYKNTTDVRQFPAAEKILELLPDFQKNRMLRRRVSRYVPVLQPYFRVIEQNRLPEERLYTGKRILASGLQKHIAYGEMRLFRDLRFTATQDHQDVLMCVLIDISASMKTEGRLERAQLLATLVAECLKECPNVESAFLGYNQNLYLCGTHEQHSISSLNPAGKTNEAAALDYLRKEHLDTPRRRKLVLVLTDGLPTSCSVESVRWLVQCMEKEQGVRFLYAALSKEEHPAYHHHVDVTGDMNIVLLRAFGKKMAAQLLHV